MLQSINNTTVILHNRFCVWNTVNGSVPQVTLSGPDLFIHMLSDFVTEATNVKFVDNLTLVTIGRKNLKSDSIQRAADQTAKWPKENKLGINATKVKESLICFGQDNSLLLIKLNGGFIKRVNQSKLLGFIISSDLKWDAYVHYINSKAAKRIHYLR